MSITQCSPLVTGTDCYLLFSGKEQIMPLFSECNIMLEGWPPRKNRPLSERQAVCIVIKVKNKVSNYTTTVPAED
jgi:hypothetical protein